MKIFEIAELGQSLVAWFHLSNNDLSRLVRINFFSIILILLFPILAGGCNVDIGRGIQDFPDTDEVLTICIPNLDSSSKFDITRSVENIPTRATMEAAEAETHINDLYLIAISMETDNNDGSNQESNIKIINLSDYKYSDDSKYRVYKISELTPGKYFFYLLGNLKSYIDGTIEDFSSREEIDNIVLNFATETNGLKLEIENLPMACLPSEMKTAANGNKMGDNPIELSDEKATTIYADMTFLCSKVRYTILFNTSGVSSEFGTQYIEFADSEEYPYATNLRQFSNLVYPGDAVKTLLSQDGALYRHPLKLKKYEYPFTGDRYGSNEDYVEQDLETEYDPANGNGSAAAWQGIVYIPENITETDTEKTLLAFSGIIYDEDGNIIDTDTYSYRTLKVDGKLQDGNRRGKLYDMVAQVTNPGAMDWNVSLNIMDWTIENLSYTLQGPFELIVSQTEFPKLTSGEWLVLGYYSDTDVSFEFPKFNDERDFFVWEYVDENTLNEEGNPYSFTDGLSSHIRFMINPEIKYEVLEKLTSQELKSFQYFNINAANLTKKIEIKEFEIKEYLSVSPKEILIDLGKYLTEGNSEGVITLNYSSNMGSEIYVSCEPSEDIFTLDNPLHLTEEEGVALTEGVLNSSSGILNIEFNRLFDGIPYWKQNHAYTLKFISGDLEPQEVKIIVKPILADYIIHFKDKSGSWSNPHIYVYEPLTLPEDLTNGQGGMPVGYKKTDGTLSPALEYDFINNISFRGWKGYGGTDLNDPYSSNTIQNGFVIFNEEPSYSPEGNSTRYDYKFNLNSSHENSMVHWGCEQCKSSTAFGISMEDEGNGWWKYTLSGMATPEKTKIVFADGHNSNLGELSYPEDGQGIELFDFANNEGWLLLKGNNGEFTEWNPDLSEEEPQGPFYRLFWPFQYGPSIVLSGNGTVIADISIGKLDSNLGYYFIDINESDVKDKDSILKYNLSGRGEKDLDLSFSEFKTGEDGNHYAYIQAMNGNGTNVSGLSGKPDSNWDGSHTSNFSGSLIVNNQRPTPEIKLNCLYYASLGYDAVYGSETVYLPEGSLIKVLGPSKSYDGVSLNGTIIQPNAQVKLTATVNNINGYNLQLEKDFNGKIYYYISDYDTSYYYLILIPD